MERLINEPILTALGGTLVHSLWQGALLALILAGVRMLIPARAAQAHYLAACAALLALLVCAVATFMGSSAGRGGDISNREERGAAAQPTRAPGEKAGARELVDDGSTIRAGNANLNAASPRLTARKILTISLPWLALAWVAGVVLLALHTLGGWFKAQRLSRSQLRTVAPEWQTRFDQLCARLKVAPVVRLYGSARVEVPTVIGWLKPVVLVPAGLMAGLSPHQVEALLAHELAHVRRYDYLVNLCQSLVETLLFYHPAVWWISNQIRLEREHCCDDIAVAHCGNAISYARALAELEELRVGGSLAMVANGGSLMSRICRLIDAPPDSNQARGWAALPVIVATFIAILLVSQTVLMAGKGQKEPRQPERKGRKVAIKFVSFPAHRSMMHNAEELNEITNKLIYKLRSHNIPAVAFVGESFLYKEGETAARTDLLRKWLDAGFELGNQSYRHLSLYKHPLPVIKENLLQGEQVMRGLMNERGQRLRYYTYPYLNTGPDAETKRAFEQFLAEQGYQIVPVTVDNMDWLFSNVYTEAKARGDRETMRRVTEEYLPYMESMIEFYEKFSVETLGYELPQILMLTAGPLTSDQFDEMVAMLKRRGYSFVSVEEALKYPAFSLPDNYTGIYGISWIQRWAITKGQSFVKEPYLPPFMRQFDIYSKSGSDFKTNNSSTQR